MKILVCINESEQARDALRLAFDLTAALEAELVVGTAIVEGSIPPTLTLEDEQLDEAFERVLELANAELPGQRFSFRTALGPASPSLLDLIEDVDADLVVVGSSHRAAVGRALFGSIGRDLMRNARCPVAVAPVGYERGDRGSGCIGAGYDGLEGGRRALGVAAALAAPLGARVDVASAESDVLPSELPMPVDPLRREALERAQEGLLLLPAALRGSAHAAVGDAAKALRTHTSDWDLLVIGTRGLGALRGFVQASVSARVVIDAGCPVIVVPEPARGELVTSPPRSARLLLGTTPKA